jgi:sugar phosphate isomerase/epimerase
MMPSHRKPALHNALWPGVVGKGEGSEPIIGMDEMLRLTAGAEFEGQRFEGVDLFLTSPHVDINSTAEDLERLATRIASFNLKVGSLVAPVWTATGGGSAMGSQDDRRRFLLQVKKACSIGKTLRELGIRPGGVIRIDSATSPADWASAPEANTQRISATFREACYIAESYGERLAAEGEICWGGMHSWAHMVELLEMVDHPETLGFQADMAHTMLFALGHNAPEHRLLPENYDWKDKSALDSALKTIADELRPWTIDFHVAQNDGTVKGSGSHDKTGRHCLPKDPNGKLDIVRHAGFWMREDGQPTEVLGHICWDGCMFPNQVMKDPETWNEILATMIAVRDAHGWNSTEATATHV